MSRKSIAIGLLIITITFVIVKVVETVFLHPKALAMPIGSWLGLIGFLLVILWYGFFVAWGAENKRFGAFRRPLNALLLSAIIGVLLWLDAKSIEAVAGWAVGGFVAGFFADKWVGGIG